MLSEDEIKKYTILCEKYFGKTLSREEVIERGEQLVRLVGLIFKPITESEFKQLQKRRKEINKNE